MPRLNFLLCCLLILVGCRQNEKSKKITNGITSISFATGGCFGRCPFVAIEIDSSLSYKYHGGSYASLKGFYSGKTTLIFWDSLINQLNRINFKSLDSEYIHSIDDLSFETIIHFDNQRKRIRAQSASLPDSILKVFNWIMESYKTAALTIAEDSLKFETEVQLLDPNMEMPPNFLK